MFKCTLMEEQINFFKSNQIKQRINKCDFTQCCNWFNNVEVKKRNSHNQL